MSDLVTDEMVETAARAAFRDGFMRHAPEHENRELSDYDDGVRESWRVVARAALEAVAPQIAADALRQAADTVDLSAYYPVPGLAELYNAEAAAEAWARRCADDIEATR